MNQGPGSHYILIGGDTIIKAGFIGPGKVGVSLARYFKHRNIDVSGFFGRNEISVNEAADMINVKAFSSIEELLENSNLIFITTPDDIIPEMDKLISKYKLSGKIVCHNSGSLKSDVLSNAEKSGALIYSIHPIFAFSDKFTDIEKLKNIYFSVEGKHTEESSVIISFMNKLGNKYFVRGADSSSAYHLASVVVSNLALSLFNIGGSYLEALGLSKDEAFDALYPLVVGNIENIRKNGYTGALTGPVARGDVIPVEKHLSVINEKDKDIYKTLSINLMKLVAERDFGENTGIEELIGKSEKYMDLYKILGGTE